MERILFWHYIEIISSFKIRSRLFSFALLIILINQSFANGAEYLSCDYGLRHSVYVGVRKYTTVNTMSFVAAPILGGIEGTNLAYTEGDVATAVTSSITVNDADNSVSSATITISGNYSTGDVLSFTNTAQITGSWDGTTGTLTLTGVTTDNNYRAALRAVKYINTNTYDPPTSTRTVTFTVNDGTSNSNTLSRNITFTSTNDAPILSTIEGTAISYTEDDPAVVITSAITVDDDGSLTGATIRITSLVNTEDILSFTNANGITGSYNTGTSTLTLTGTTSVANYQAALRSITYLNTDTNDPVTTTRTIQFTVTDGTNSNSLTRNITITKVNDAPTAKNDVRSTTVNTALTSNCKNNDSDVENNSLTVNTSPVAQPSHGTVSLSSDGSYTYTPTTSWTGTDSFTYQVCDNGTPSLCSQGTVTIYVNAGNSNYYSSGSNVTEISTNCFAITPAEAGNQGWLWNTSPLNLTYSFELDFNVLLSELGVTNDGGADGLIFVLQRDVTPPPANTTDSPLKAQGTTGFQLGYGGISPSIGISFDTYTNTGEVAYDFLSISKNGVVSTMLAGPIAAKVDGSNNPVDIEDGVYHPVKIQWDKATNTLKVYFDGVQRLSLTNDITTNIFAGDPTNIYWGFAASTGLYYNYQGVCDISLTSSSNTAPVLAASESIALTYSRAQAGTAITSTTTVTDAENTSLSGATAQITTNFVYGEDVLAFTDANGIAGSWNAASGILTLSGSASLANYQTALRSITYRNTNNTSPSALIRTVSFTVNDGIANSNTVTRNITISATPSDYYTAGTNVAQLSTNCFMMTPASNGQSGWVWKTTPLDLRYSFELNCNLLLSALGVAHDGADGMSFVLQRDVTPPPANTTDTPLNAQGVTGGELGYGNISPSVDIEFDTWQNASDPSYDHIAICSNGDVNAVIAGPIAAKVDGSNNPLDIEDGVYHPVIIRWDKPSTTLKVFFDGVQRLSLTQDIATAIFAGDPTGVYWGFTASTGGSNNYHGVCDIAMNITNLVPVVGNDSYSTNEDTALNGSGLLTNDSDPESGTLTVTAETKSTTNGSVTINANGTFTYTPTSNYNGSDSFTYTVCDNYASPGCTQGTVTITVQPVNDVPTFTKGADQAVNENAGAQTLSWATLIDDGDPDLTQTLSFNVTNNNNALFSVQPTVSSNGDLSYTPATNANGLATVTVTISDNGSGVAPNVNISASQTFTITVAASAVNNAPSFTKGGNQSVNEDAVAQTITTWATAIDDGDAGLTQTLTFNVSNDNNALFSSQPAINASGDLTYTPAANANGSATVTVTISDNGSGIAPNVNTSAAQTFTITVASVNDVPSFTKGANESVNEDAGAQSVITWATAISDGDPELSQTLTFNVSNDNNALFSVQPAISATGTLTYTPAANGNGSATVTVTISDNGSGVAPNVNTSAAQTFTITVATVNDVPSFTKGANESVNEDAGAQSVITWATAISDGDPELSQTLTFNVSNDNNALFSVQPAISAIGTLTYTPAANANGLATVTVTLSDNGSGVAPNVNTSAAQTFTVTVAAVNDVPSFTKGANESVNEDAGAQSVITWATAISDGDPELSQTLTFNVSNDNNALFSVQPAISATGTLTYTPAANGNGSATVTVTISDNGSGVAPNVNTSAAQTFTITVAAVNDVPSFTKGANESVNEDAGAQSVITWATAISDGDPELSQTLTFNVSNDNNALFSVQPAISATGDLTYTPAANGNGSATVTVTISDNGSGVAPNVNTSAAQTFTITVAAVNDVPSFTKGANESVNEDAGAQSVTTWATAISDGDPELSQTLTFNVSNDNNALFSVQPAISATGTLTYTPAANGNGSATVTVTISDNGSGVAPNVNASVAQTFTITVAAVNDVPSFTKGANESVNEDAGAQSVTTWATAINDGDPELSQTLTFNVSNDNNALFSVQPAINATGTLTYTPAANGNGSATVTVTISDNGSGVAPNVNTSAAQTFTITVAAVNDVPSFTKGANESVNEDAGSQTVTTWATAISDGDPELSQTLTFNVSNDNNALFSVQPAISATGTLTYTPAANGNGSATVTVTISDNGSGVAPNVNTSAAQTFTITVAAVNDVPSFTKGANESVNEDAGAQSVTTWATVISDGDPELSQTLSFNVSNDNNALFSVQPAISATGDLTYTPAANGNGSATVTVTISDNGSGVAPNVNTSAAQTFTITVAAVNDVPSFTKGANESVNEDAGAQSVITWATAISDGDPELSQTLTFNVSNDNNALFSVQPTISAIGTLTYTPAVNANGSATVTVTISDNGSGVAPNVNTSAAQTFTITVAAVNDVPSFTKGANESVNEDAGVQSISGWATAISDGDPELSQTLTFNVSNDNNALFTVQPSINASGHLIYKPAPNTSGLATVTVTISDNGSGVAPNINTSVAQTFTITVSGINDVPSFTKGANESVNEDAGAQTITTWATAIDDGDADLTQTLTFSLSNDNNALFSVQPSISVTGDLTYTLAGNANGLATVTVTLSDDGSGVAPNVNTSAAQTFTITVAPVNDVPSFTKGANESVNEDAGAQTVITWATVISDGDPELSQTLTFNVSNDNNALFSIQPVINASGDLTYTPTTGTTGSATVSVTLSDNGSGVAPNINTSVAQTFTITVSGINDVPSFTKGANESVNEDAGAQTITTWATAIDDGDADLTQTLTFSLSNDNNALFSVQPSISVTGDLTYTLAGNANGLATVTVTLSDDGSGVAPNVNTSAAQTFTITVAPVNDVPSFTKGANESVNEDAGAQTVITWATVISDGDPELSQTLTFNVSNDNNALFSIQPVINASGDLTYTPTTGTTGSATVSVTLSDNGSGVAPNINTSVAQTFTITVTGINDVPSFTKGSNQSVNEDAGAQTITTWATAIDDGDASVTQTLTFNVSNDNNALFSVQPSINATGDLTYTLAANANGLATVTVTISDNGSGVAPNVNTSAAQTFTITVAAVNDVPSFTKGANQSVNEDAGAQSVATWATAISDGDPELSQTLTFSLSNDNNALFSVPPSINASGDLAYTPAANANGLATVTVTISDNGSGVAPNVNTSAAQTFTVTVAAVNDVPSFTKGANQSVNEDAGAQSVTTWATAISDGDPEISQTLSFNVSNDNNALFSVQPAISATGTLTYTPAPSVSGVAIVTVAISDNGSGVAPNANTSASQTFTITVTATNNPPVATNDVSTTQSDTPVGISVLLNDNDADGGIVPSSIVIMTSPTHGSLSIDVVTGIITYTPDAGYTGNDSFTYTITDNLGAVSNTATVNLTIGRDTHVNNPPVAVDDGPITHNSVLPVDINVLANDSDPDNDGLTIVSVTTPTFGTVTINGGQLTYQPAGTTSGTVTFKYTIADPEGLTAEANVTIQYKYDPFMVSEGFSPNGDGNNDTWYIRNIEAYPTNTLKVFDRWGLLVYQTKNYNNTTVVWDGSSNTGVQSGTFVDQGTYYYALNLGPEGGLKSGYLEIVK